VSTESLIESALSAGMIEIMKDYICKFSTDDDVMLMVLLAVGSLADSGNLQACSFVPDLFDGLGDFLCMVVWWTDITLLDPCYRLALFQRPFFNTFVDPILAVLCLVAC